MLEATIRMKVRAVIAIPTLNEEDYIEGVIADLQADPATRACEILVMDGGSTDRTQEIVRAMTYDNVQLVFNPGRNQACALNLAAKTALEMEAEYLIRIDAHAAYPRDYISVLMKTALEEKVDSVVVPLITVGGTRLQEDAAMLQRSWLGNGGSPHRNGSYRGPVEHGHHALFSLEAYTAIGGYDTRFVANEDAEFDKRMIAGGYKIFLENKTRVEYFPRTDYKGIWRQMHRNGRYRIYTAVKHVDFLGLRQIVPIMVSPVLLGSLALALVVSPYALAIPALYFGLVMGLSAKAMQGAKFGMLRWISGLFSIALMGVLSHIGFSIGALTSIMRFYITEPKTRRELRQHWRIGQSRTSGTHLSHMPLNSSLAS